MLVRRIVDIRAVEEGAGRDIVEDNLPCNERVARQGQARVGGKRRVVALIPKSGRGRTVPITMDLSVLTLPIPEDERK